MQSTLVTAVSLYGPKGGPLREALAAIQAMLARNLGAAFAPYSLEQVHGTLIVLSGRRDETGAVLNQYYLEYRNERRAMNFGRVQQLMRDHLAEPLTIRIGGFGARDQVAFTSRARHLHERSFSAQAGSLVLMGWPAAALESAGQFQPLDNLRRSMTAAGVLHRYYVLPADIDDDFHLVVGHYADTGQDRVTTAVQAVRAYLAGHPVDVQVGLDQVRIIAADSPTLAAARFSSGLPVAPGLLASLYE